MTALPPNAIGFYYNGSRYTAVYYTATPDTGDYPGDPPELGLIWKRQDGQWLPDAWLEGLVDDEYEKVYTEMLEIVDTIYCNNTDADYKKFMDDLKELDKDTIKALDSVQECSIRVY